MSRFFHSARVDLERIAAELIGLSDDELSGLIRSGAILDKPAFAMGRSMDLAAFYAPFEWINEDADIVILGVTPGKQQAKAALAKLRKELRTGRSLPSAMQVAKEEASFAGEMRTIASRLMDHFHMNDLFGLPSTSALFGQSRNRVHYTSVYRYPVLRRERAGWGNYPGGVSKPIPGPAAQICNRIVGQGSGPLSSYEVTAAKAVSRIPLARCSSAT